MDDKKETKKLDTKRIFVLGNGFDLAHYLPTAYVHFMDAMRVIESCKEDVHLSLIENEEVTGQSGHVRNCLNQVKIS